MEVCQSARAIRDYVSEPFLASFYGGSSWVFRPFRLSLYKEVAYGHVGRPDSPSGVDWDCLRDLVQADPELCGDVGPDCIADVVSGPSFGFQSYEDTEVFSGRGGGYWLSLATCVWLLLMLVWGSIVPGSSPGSGRSEPDLVSESA